MKSPSLRGAFCFSAAREFELCSPQGCCSIRGAKRRQADHREAHLSGRANWNKGPQVSGNSFFGQVPKRFPNRRLIFLLSARGSGNSPFFRRRSPECLVSGSGELPLTARSGYN
jgi:hypothetical protein